MKIVTIVGARPQFIKAVVVQLLMRKTLRQERFSTNEYSNIIDPKFWKEKQNLCQRCTKRSL